MVLVASACILADNNWKDNKVVSGSLYNRWWIKNLYPITVWILDESQTFHDTVIRSLNKVDTLLLEMFARLVNVRHHNANVPEATWRFVTVMILLIRIRLGAPVTVNMREQDCFLFVSMTCPEKTKPYWVNSRVALRLNAQRERSVLLVGMSAALS